MPQPVSLSPFIQPAKLPTDCSANMDGEYAIAVGNGRKYFNRPHDKDTKLRHAYLQITSSRICHIGTYFVKGGSLICAVSNNGQTVNRGDSGNTNDFFSNYCIK